MRETNHWFVALRHITREDPIPPESYADMEKMKDAWLKWGRIRNLI